MTEQTCMQEAQCSRIMRMEQLLDRSAAVLEQLDAALSALEAVQPEIEQLAVYYQSEDWMHDYEDDAAGRLPAALKRGVLSQDAVYDLLTDHQRLLETMRQIAQTAEA